MSLPKRDPSTRIIEDAVNTTGSLYADQERTKNRLDHIATPFSDKRPQAKKKAQAKGKGQAKKKAKK
ncbi:hypothetical protein LguiA_007775 [Lonicera macranthoides]